MTVVLAALLAIGNTALAANTWTVEYVTSTSKFKISRSGDTSISETVQYRTVSLSALAGQHFTEKTGTVTFGAGDTDKEIAVTETPSANVAEQYHFQTGTSRSYRFEVLDQGGFLLAYCNRDITYGSTYQHSASYVNKSITDLVYFNNGSLASGSGNKYLDVAHSGTSGSYKMIDDGYDYNDNTLCTLSTGSLYSSSALRTYLNRNYNNYKMYATVYFTMYEEDDGYQYIQILTDNSSTYDGKDGDGKIDNGPDKSVYKAAFILTKSEDHCTSDHYQAFPHRYDYKNRTEGSQTASHTEFEYADSYLYQQKFYSDSYRASNSGSLILAPTVNNINVRFDANGGGADTWYVKNLKVRLALVDSKAPTVLSYSVAPGTHAKGNTVYVSVAFSEIVTGTSSKLTSNWGDLSYMAGSGSNVLTFSRTIPASASSSLNITGYSGITDLAGNAPSSVSATGICAVDASHSFTITYNLDGGTVATDNPTSYTWETAAFTLNNPARTGYWFDGWTGSNGNTPLTTVTIANHSHENKTFTANWTQVWTGSGTQGDPYVITTTKGLDLLAMYVNGLGGNTAHNCSGVYFQLGGDIAYTYTDAWDLASSTENNYTRIGNGGLGFQGTFDGQGYTISGIRLYKGDQTDADSGQGLFGGVLEGGIVKRVNLADARITGYSRVGGIAGQSFSATVEDCTVAADVCIHAVNSTSMCHGGIVGFNQGTVQRCLSRATLSVANATGCKEYGAIVGNAQGYIYDCIVVGAIVPDVSKAGTLFGYNNSTFRRNYYFSCTVAGTPNATDVGVGSDSGNSSPHDITANHGAQALYSLTLPDGVTLVRNASATLLGTGNKTYTTGADIDGTPYAYDGAALTLSYTGAAPAQGYNIALYVNGVQATDNGNGTYTATMPAEDATVTVSAVAKDFTADGHSGDSEADAYIIYNKDQLDMLAKMVNGTNGYAENTFEGKYIKLANDITYTHTSNWNNANSTENNYTAIGRRNVNTFYYFQGIFDGDNHTVSGIRIYKGGNSDSDMYQGLFGYVGQTGTVKNVTVSDTRVAGYRDAGSIVGANLGTVTNCHASNTVAITSVSNYPAEYLGGIIGYNGSNGTSNGTILNCTSAATLTANNQSSLYYGAIAGQNRGRIENCHAVYASIPVINRAYGVITGHNNGTLTANYYYGCTVGDTANAVNVGVGSSEGAPADQSGARSVHALTLPAGVTASGESVDIDATTYFAAGTTVTLSHGSAPAGYQEPLLGYSLNSTPIDGNSFEMPAADAVVTARWTVKDFEIGHAGTEADPYVIYNKDQLNLLATRVNSGNNYSSGKYFKLGADVEYDGTDNNYTTIGHDYKSSKQFMGTFDGNGYTVSGININNSSKNNQGLFGYVVGTVKNVILANSYIQGNRYVGGIAGRVNPGTVKNCLVIESSIIADSLKGVIVGDNSGGTLSNNYYFNCRVSNYAMDVGCDNHDYYDNDGAVRTVTSVTKPAEIGEQIVSCQGGLTVYEHGAYYNGTYYLIWKLAGTAEALTLVQGTKDGVSAFWGTFFDSTKNYELSECAAAFTMGTDFKLYRLGTNGRTIPKGVAVVIISTAADAFLVPAGTGDLSITDHASGGNILVGNDADTDYAAIYVLSVDSLGEVGFRKLSIGDLPAHKAGYERRAGMQDYDKQDNQEW